MEIGSLHYVASALKAISEKQKVTSNNLANAHTPGYLAKEVNFSDLLNGMNNPFETQLSQKMGTTMSDSMSTGMPVDMQKEMIEMQKNLLFYNMTTRRASTIFTLLKSATQVGR